MKTQQQKKNKGDGSDLIFWLLLFFPLFLSNEPKEKAPEVSNQIKIEGEKASVEEEKGIVSELIHQMTWGELAFLQL